MIKNSVAKTAIKLWSRLLLASVLSFIVWVSMNAMGTAFFSDVVGYRVYDADNQLLIEHIYTEGEDKNAEIKIEEGQTLLKLRKTSEGTDIAMALLSSAFTLTMLGLFPYNILWNIGTRDANYVQFGKMERDRLFGLKVGAAASIPTGILYMLLVLGKCGLFPGVIVNWFRILNPAFIPFIDAMVQGAKSAADVSVVAVLALVAVVLFVPAVAALGYALGYRQISLRERLLYKKKTDD